MSPVRIVTDSTADLPPDLLARLGITVVPCFINIGTQSYEDGVDMRREQFYRDLPGWSETPKTAAPPSGAFAAHYERLLASGDRVLSLHPAATLSGIYNSARLGAEALDRPAGQIEVLDCGQLSMGLGWQVVAAAELGRSTDDLAAVASFARTLNARTYVYATVNTLEFLRRSGRVSWTEAGMGGLLQIKPMFQLHQGQLATLERTRTRQRSLQRLVELTRSHAPLAYLAVMHANAPQEAEALRQQFADLSPTIPVVDVTPVIGAHVGPGALGVAVVTA